MDQGIIRTDCDHIIDRNYFEKWFLTCVNRRLNFCCPVCNKRIKYDDQKMIRNIMNNKLKNEVNLLKVGRKYMIKSRIFPNLIIVGELSFISGVFEGKYYCKFGDDFYVSNIWEFIEI